MAHVGLKASAAKQMTTALFWGITQRTVLFTYRRFGETFRYRHTMKLFFLDILTLEDATDRLSQKCESNYQYTLCNTQEERRFEVVYVEGGLNVFRNLTARDLGTCLLIRRKCCVFVQGRSALKFKKLYEVEPYRK